MIEPMGPDPSQPEPSRPEPSRPEVEPVRSIGPRHESGATGPLDGLRRGAKRSASGRSPEPVTAGRAAIGAVVEVVVVLAMALFLSLLIKTFLVQAFFIPSASMETTLLIGDRVLVSKLTPHPFALHHGDIVVFKDPGGWLQTPQPADDGAFKSGLRSTLTWIGLLPQDSGEHLIKRVIGLPGDTVQCCDAKGRVSVNGVAIDETPYLYAGDEPSLRQFSITVPAGKLWVQGDHRTVSDDSRAHQDLDGGFVPVTDVVGKAFVVVWPFNRAGGLGVPDQVFATVPERESS